MTDDGGFQVALTSPRDREFLVTEVYFDGHQTAEINCEIGQLRVEIYPRGDELIWDLPFQEFFAANREAGEWLESRLVEPSDNSDR